MDKIIESLLDLNSGDPIPPVNENSLKAAHSGLTKHLSTPLTAVYSEPENDESDAEFKVEISQILPVDDHPVFGPYLGILCEAALNEENTETIVVPLARITDVKNEDQRAYVEAYNEWFWNFR